MFLLYIVEENMKKEGKHFKKKKINKKFYILLIIIFITSISFIIYNKYNQSKNEKINEEVQEFISTNNDKNNSNSENIERIEKVKELQKENSDIVGWLEIENSNINYPVLQGEDNSFYMTHNYKKEYSVDGSIFLDKDYDWNIPSANLLLYGHNNRGSKEMFVDLMNYKDENYYKKHKIIRFTTNEEDAEYEIISVFLSRVYYKHETNVFRYYYFINAANEQEFNNYVKNSKKASLYNIDTTAKYGDQLLTLSTCEFSQEDGRLAVVARKINNSNN